MMLSAVRNNKKNNVLNYDLMTKRKGRQFKILSYLLFVNKIVYLKIIQIKYLSDR